MIIHIFYHLFVDIRHFYLKISIVQNFNHINEFIIHHEIFDFVEERDV